MPNHTRVAASLLASLVALAANGLFAEEPAAALVAPKSPVSPDEERAAFHVPAELRIDLIAGEPQIESPVHCAFDERGRLWVVELRDYPNGPAEGEPPAGRVKVLDDRDGDGRYETATLFADGLLFANSVLPWNGGVIVTAAPQILFLKDADGDGKADVREVWYEGFAAGNPQLRVSHPVLGLDGWIYVANGLRGGEIRSKLAPDAPAIAIGGKDFRFDPFHGRAEAVPGPGQFGNTIDAWGERFVCDNRNHLRHVVFPIDPGVRNPLLATPSLLEDTAGPSDGPLSSGSRVFPLSQNWTTSNLHAGRFTASCGVFADRGALLPAPFADGLFTCEPTGNLVHLERLAPNGATFGSTPWRPERGEFLASPEEWFRPVSIAQAPDGALALVDMYRAVIEHPEFMPPELKNRPDLKLGADRGRIWRIAPKDAPPGRAPTPTDLSNPELIAALEHPNGWRRTTAQRLLMSESRRLDEHARTATLVEPLAAFARSTKSPEGLVHAMWLLKWLGLEPRDARRGEVERRALAHADPRVRLNAARAREDALAGPNPALNDYRALASDADPRVRFQTALSLGACDDDAIVPLLATIATRDAGDRWTRVAVASSSAGRTGRLVVAILADAAAGAGDPSPSRAALLQELCELVGAGRSPEEAKVVLDALAARPAAWRRFGLAGLAEGVSRRGTPFPQFLATLPGGADATIELLASAAAPASDPNADDAERVAATRLLAHTPWETSGATLSKLLTAEDASPAVRLATVRSLAAHARPEVASLLLASWRAYTPAVRGEVLDALLRRSEWTHALLDAVEAGKIKPADVDPTRARRLVSSTDADLAARAKRVLRDALPADRAGVIERYRAALSLAGDLDRGREVFRKNCAGCHAVAGVGSNVGPDVSDTRTKTPEMLLTDILNPNAAIDGNFVSYSVTTLDGRVLTGVVASESAAGLVLKRENNQTETVLRADVEEIWSSGLSLMPEGLEKALTPQDVADVIHFLKRWRFAGGAVPAGP